MKIKITQMCECMYKRTGDIEPFEVRVDLNKVIWGIIVPSQNLETKAIDVYNKDESFYGIPNDCWTKIA